MTEIFRVVRCKICGRTLTNPLSVERGIGPVCWARVTMRKTYLEADRMDLKAEEDDG